MEKWFFIFLSVAAVSLATSITIQNTFNTTKIDLAKVGLEECPATGAGRSGSTIWVKSCTEYTNSIKEK